MIRTSIALILAAACSGGAAADTVIVTQNAAGTGGTGAYSTVLNSQPRSWLTVIGQAELSGRLPVGARITGVSWRLASWQAFASWPASTVIFNSFDIYLGIAARSPGNLDMTNVANNWGPDLTLTHAGGTVFSPGYFPGGAVSPSFNPFCTPINLLPTYTYQGGDLLIMVRHTGNNASNGNLDWVSSSFGASGAQGISVSSYTSNTGWGGGGNGGCIVMQFTYTLEAPCYANCDNSSNPPVLNINDYTCFLNRYAGGDSYANCDHSTTPPVLNVNDFTCFLNTYAAGCP